MLCFDWLNERGQNIHHCHSRVSKWNWGVECRKSSTKLNAITAPGLPECCMLNGKGQNGLHYHSKATKECRQSGAQMDIMAKVCWIFYDWAVHCHKRVAKVCQSVVHLKSGSKMYNSKMIAIAEKGHLNLPECVLYLSFLLLLYFHTAVVLYWKVVLIRDSWLWCSPSCKIHAGATQRCLEYSQQTTESPSIEIWRFKNLHV